MPLEEDKLTEKDQKHFESILDLDTSSFVDVVKEIADEFFHLEDPYLKHDILNKVVSNAVNISRFAYAVKSFQGDIGGKSFDIDGHRPIHKEDGEEQNEKDGLFNESLDRYLPFLIDHIEVLKTYKVKGIGGTSYIAKFDELLKDEYGNQDPKKDVSFKNWIIVGFRGTSEKSEWGDTNFKLTDYDYKPFNDIEDYKNPKWYEDLRIHGGFYKALSALTPKYDENDEIEQEYLRKTNKTKEEISSDFGPFEDYDIFKDLKSILDQHNGYKLVISGHSLGGALAALFGLEAQALGWNPTVITVASPQVGFYKGQPKNDMLVGNLFTSLDDKLERLYLKKILTHFDITDEVVLEKKINAIKNADIDAIFDPNSSFFLNVINDSDLVPIVPPYRYQELGGFPLIIDDTHVSLRSLFNIEETNIQQKLKFYSKDFRGKATKALKQELDEDLIREINKELEQSEQLGTKQTKITREEYQKTPFKEDHGQSPKILKILAKYGQKNGIAVGELVWIATRPENLFRFRKNHSFYAFYALGNSSDLSYEDFPLIETSEKTLKRPFSSVETKK